MPNTQGLNFFVLDQFSDKVYFGLQSPYIFANTLCTLFRQTLTNYYILVQYCKGKKTYCLNAIDKKKGEHIHHTMIPETIIPKDY